MTTLMKTLALSTGFAALAVASPASAQYYQQYGNAYGYQYGNAYGHNNTANMAAQRCTAAVQQRLSVRGSRGILGTLFGVQNYNSARVLSVTQVNPRRNNVTLRGLASSGRMAAYNPYGAGAYGMLGSNYVQPDLSFRCSVDYRGYVRDIDINRR